MQEIPQAEGSIYLLPYNPFYPAAADPNPSLLHAVLTD
jgi:hypothetical protein